MKMFPEICFPMGSSFVSLEWGDTVFPIWISFVWWLFITHDIFATRCTTEKDKIRRTLRIMIGKLDGWYKGIEKSDPQVNISKVSNVTPKMIGQKEIGKQTRSAIGRAVGRAVPVIARPSHALPGRRAEGRVC